MREYYQCMDCGKSIFNPSPEELGECFNCKSSNIEEGYSPDYEDKKQRELSAFTIPAFYKNTSELKIYVNQLLQDKNLLKEISIETQAFNTIRISEATELKLHLNDEAYLKLFISKDFYNVNLYDKNNFCINSIGGKPSSEESKDLKMISKNIMNSYVERFL